MDGENENRSRGTGFYYLTGCIEAVEGGHTNVHDGDIWPQSFGLFNSFSSGRSLAADLPKWIRLQDHLDSFSDDVVIIGEEDPDGRSCSGFAERHVQFPSVLRERQSRSRWLVEIGRGRFRHADPHLMCLSCSIGPERECAKMR